MSSSRKVNTSRKPFCKVCQDAGKSESEWGHWPKDNKTGKTTCPTLLSQKCRYCDKAGHTVKYCTKLAKDNAKKERIEKQEQVPEKKRTTVESNNRNRFALLLDNDSDDEEPKQPPQEQKKQEQEYPELCAPIFTKGDTSISNRVTFSDMVRKPVEVVEEEKRTRDEERLIQAIQSGMVVLKQKPSTKPVKRYAKWTDADDEDSSDEEDTNFAVSNDAW